MIFINCLDSTMRFMLAQSAAQVPVKYVSVQSGAHKRKERVTWLRNCLQTIELRMRMCGKHVVSITKYGAFTQPSAVMDDLRLTIIRPVSNMMGGMYPKFRAQG